MIPRDYQEAAIETVFSHWEKGGGNALVEMATGTGKAFTLALLIRRVLERWPSMRVLMLCPNKELVVQNAAELLRLWPACPLGINSASVGRRDTRSRVLCATVNSIYRNPELIGPRDLILPDECHLIPRSGDGMYRQLITALMAIEPDLRILGMSATCFRTDSGLLHRGKDALFEDVIFTYGIKEGVEGGYLSPLISRPTDARIDVSKVHVRGGEFVAGELEAASMANVREAVAEMVAYGQDRRAWLAFCAGIKHAHAVCAAVREHSVSCEVVTGDTPAGERDRIIRDYKAGRIRCLANVNVLTTGFNVPHVDMLAMLRATLSTGLYVQMVGRGTRTAEGKSDCLVLDFASVVRTHGPVDAINVRMRNNGEDIERVKPDDVRSKECPECGQLLAIQARACPCGYQYPKDDTPKHEAYADRSAVIMASVIPPEWKQITSVRFDKWVKVGKAPSLRVTYHAGPLNFYYEWVPIEAPKGRGIAEKWWRRMSGLPCPLTVDDAMKRIAELTWPAEILVKPEGKYWRVVSHKMPAREVAA